MIRFDSAGPDVRVIVTAPYPVSREFTLTFGVGVDWAARLLSFTLRSVLAQHLMRIRFEAYQQGWKDAKAKRKKRDQHEQFQSGWGE